MAEPRPGTPWVVIPVHGDLPHDLLRFTQDLETAGFQIALVDNRPAESSARQAGGRAGPSPPWPGLWLRNRNRGGLAGGFNAGVAAACNAGAGWITLLDQDSRLEPALLHLLREAWNHWPGEDLIVGPAVIDARRGGRHGRVRAVEGPWDGTRLLISSGTTFRAADWPRLGPLHEGLFIDFLDHAWCFRAQARGFRLLQDRRVELRQSFGHPHPHPLCRRLGMELYGPERHAYALRNLRWLCRQSEVPLDLKVKEVLKMLGKPWLWLLGEPGRRANARAIWRGLTAPLPGPHP